MIICKLDLAREMGSDLVEVTSHFGARPTHAEWQGQIYSLSGKHPVYKEFRSATGFGRGDGLGGWNCRHSFYPYFEGRGGPRGHDASLENSGFSQTTAEFTEQQFIKDRRVMTAEGFRENLEMYENQQKQRAYERAVRRSKRELAGIDAARSAANDPKLKEKLGREFMRKSVTLKNREERLSQFCKDKGLMPDNARVRVEGFGKSVSQKAVWANRKYNSQNGLTSAGNSGKIDTRNMANGLRRSRNIPLTDEEKDFIKGEITAINADSSKFVFRENGATGYSDKYDIVFVGSNVFRPNDDSKHPRDLMSERAVLAHEYYGHRANRGTKLKEGSWNDEFRASYFAAKNCPNLSDEDRYYLVLDALERAKEAGVSIQYNDFIRSVLYG